MSRKFLVMLAVLLVALVATACGSPAASSSPEKVGAATLPAGQGSLPKGAITLNGAGSTFMEPVVSEWRFAYQYVDPTVVINYQGIGSGGGKKGIAEKTLDFAGSDSLLKPDEVAKAPGLQMFPVLAGAVVPIYNIKEITQSLTFDGNVLANIYLGKITKWNDPAIAKLNPGLPLPDRNITAVHRSDGSGTTEIFTKFLASVSTDWANGPKAGSAVEWPVDKAGNGIGGKGNPGVAAAVQNTPDSVGYVELSYAVANKINFADMVNKAGKTIKASPAGVEAAIADYGDKFSDNLTVDMISNGPGEKTWPIAGYTYMIVYKDMAPDPTYGCGKPQKFLDFVYWAMTDPAAAKRAADLGYSVLPASVRAKVFSTLALLTCNGKPMDTMIAKNAK